MISTNESNKQFSRAADPNPSQQAHSHQQRFDQALLKSLHVASKLPPLYRSKQGQQQLYDHSTPPTKSRNQQLYSTNNTPYQQEIYLTASAEINPSLARDLRGTVNFSQVKLLEGQRGFSQTGIHSQTQPGQGNIIEMTKEDYFENMGTLRQSKASNQPTMLEQFKQSNYNEDHHGQSKELSKDSSSLSQMLKYNVTPSNTLKKEFLANQCSSQQLLNEQQVRNLSHHYLSQKSKGTVPVSLQSYLEQKRLELEQQKDQRTIMNNPSNERVNQYREKGYAFVSPIGIKIDARDVVNFDYRIFYNELKNDSSSINNLSRANFLSKNQTLNNSLESQFQASQLKFNLPNKSRYGDQQNFKESVDLDGAESGSSLVAKNSKHGGMISSRKQNLSQKLPLLPIIGQRSLFNQSLESLQSLEQDLQNTGQQFPDMDLSKTSVKPINIPSLKLNQISNYRDKTKPLKLNEVRIPGQYSQPSLFFQSGKSPEQPQPFQKSQISMLNSPLIKSKGFSHSKIDKLMFENKQKHRQFIIDQLRQKQTQGNMNFTQNYGISKNQKNSSLLFSSAESFQNNQQDTNEIQNGNSIQNLFPKDASPIGGNGRTRNQQSLLFSTIQDSSQFGGSKKLSQQNQMPQQVKKSSMIQSVGSSSSLENKKQKILDILYKTLQPLQNSNTSNGVGGKTMKEAFNKTLIKASELISQKVLASNAQSRNSNYDPLTANQSSYLSQEEEIKTESSITQQERASMFNEIVKNKEINPILQKLISKSLSIAKNYQQEKELNNRQNQLKNLRQIVVDKLSTPLKQVKKEMPSSVQSSSKQSSTLQPNNSTSKLQRQNSKRSKDPPAKEQPPKKIIQVIKEASQLNQSKKLSASSNSLTGKLKGILKNSIQTTANHSKANSSRGASKGRQSSQKNKAMENPTQAGNVSEFLPATQSSKEPTQSSNKIQLLKLLQSQSSTPSASQSQQQSLNNSQVQLAKKLLMLLQSKNQSANASKQDSQNQSVANSTFGLQDSLMRGRDSEERISSPRTRLYGLTQEKPAIQRKPPVVLNPVQQRIQEALTASRQKQIEKQKLSSHSLQTPLKQDTFSYQQKPMSQDSKEDNQMQNPREKVGQILSNILLENRQLKEKLQKKNKGENVSPEPLTRQSEAARIQQVLKILQGKKEPSSSPKPEIKLLNPQSSQSLHPSQIFTPTLPDLDASVKSMKPNTDIMKRLSSGDTNINSQPTDISSKRYKNNDLPNQLQVPNMIDQYLFGNQSGERSVSQSLKQKRLLPLKSGEDVKIKDRLTVQDQDYNHRSNSQPRIVISTSNPKQNLSQSPTNPLMSSNLTFNYDANDNNMIRTHQSPSKNHFQVLEGKRRLDHSAKKENSFLLSTSRANDKSGGFSNTRKSSNAQEESKTRQFADFQGGNERKVNGRSAKEIVKERRNLKYLLLLKQRKERWDHQQNHPILGGFDASMKDKESKKTKKIQMNIQKLDAIMEDIKKEKRQKFRRQGLIFEDQGQANEFRRRVSSGLDISNNRRQNDNMEDDGESQDFDSPQKTDTARLKQ